MLRIIGFLVPFLIAMKKRMFVPVLMRMLPNMFGEYKAFLRSLVRLI